MWAMPLETSSRGIFGEISVLNVFGNCERSSPLGFRESSEGGFPCLNSSPGGKELSTCPKNPPPFPSLQSSSHHPVPESIVVETRFFLSSLQPRPPLYSSQKDVGCTENLPPPDTTRTRRLYCWNHRKDRQTI